MIFGNEIFLFAGNYRSFLPVLHLTQAGSDHSYANIMWMVVIVASFGLVFLASQEDEDRTIIFM